MAIDGCKPVKHRAGRRRRNMMDIISLTAIAIGIVATAFQFWYNEDGFLFEDDDEEVVE